MDDRVISKLAAVDPQFAGMYARLYPGSPIAKMHDASELNTGTADQQAKKKRMLGAGLLFGTAAEGLSVTRAGQHAATAVGLKTPPSIHGVLSRIPKVKMPLAGTPAAKVGEFGVQAVNAGIGLTAAHELLKKPKVKPPAATAPVTKSLGTGELSFTGEIAKVDTDKRQVFGWCSLSSIGGVDVVDLQGDFVPIEEIEKSAYHYVINSRKGGDMHRRVSKADEPLHTSDLVESFVVTPEKLEKMGLPADALPHGWWVGFKVNDDEQWDLVKSGKRTGFSIHGTGTRKDMA